MERESDRKRCICAQSSSASVFFFPFSHSLCLCFPPHFPKKVWRAFCIKKQRSEVVEYEPTGSLTRVTMHRSWIMNLMMSPTPFFCLLERHFFFGKLLERLPIAQPNKLNNVDRYQRNKFSFIEVKSFHLPLILKELLIFFWLTKNF